jgi:hypothetical protein
VQLPCAGQNQPMSVHETINSEHYVRLILSPFFGQPTDNTELYRKMMQDHATAHSVNNSMVALDDIFGEQVTNWRLWPPRSVDLNTSDFYLWGTLKEGMYMKNAHSLKDLSANIRHEISIVLAQQLQCVSKTYHHSASHNQKQRADTLRIFYEIR